MRSCYKVVVVMLALVTGMAQGYLKPYEISPTRANWSGWTPRDGYIAQTVTCCWDSMVALDLFVGQCPDTHSFNVDVYEYPDGSEWIARKHGVRPSGSEKWLRFDLETHAGQEFVRGKEYIVRIFRPDSAC